MDKTIKASAAEVCVISYHFVRIDTESSSYVFSRHKIKKNVHTLLGSKYVDIIIRMYLLN